MRVAFSIVFNAEHHLRHLDHFKNLIPHFDKWVFAEGAVRPVGSTSWCNNIGDEYQNNGNSVDGTLEYLKDLKRLYPDKVSIIKSSNGFWNGKDEMVNACIATLKQTTSRAFLWEFDSDEKWSIENIERAEKILLESNKKCFSCNCNHYIGNNLVVVNGPWGGDSWWNRLWKWEGENFKTHEPPVLVGQTSQYELFHNEKMFDHYAYYFEKDVIFKSKFYKFHEGVYDGWKKLREMNDQDFPCDLSVLFGHSMYRASINKLGDGL